MYKDLVRRLRNCATGAIACKTCDLKEDSSCSDILMKQAADAIEELSKRVPPVPHGRLIDANVIRTKIVDDETYITKLEPLSDEKKQALMCGDWGRVDESANDMMTNADRIRAMSNEELADFLHNMEEHCPDLKHIGNCAKYYGCTDCWLDWLKEEVKDD